MIWIPILTVIILLVALTWLARKKWPVITILLYTLWVTVVFMPAVLFMALWLSDKGPDLGDIGDFYGKFWPFWIFCAILITSQFLLLVVPVKIVKQRPNPQRSFWVTAITAGVLFAIVALGIAWSIAVAIWGDDAIDGDIALWLAPVFLLVNWLVWSLVFRTFAHNADPRSYIRRLMKWLLHGTILELLIAVPSHVIARHKDVCCAHGVTAAGIATGLAIMLISFGPGIYFMYAERIEGKEPKKKVTGQDSPA
jgi:hypothetical protein